MILLRHLPCRLPLSQPIVGSVLHGEKLKYMVVKFVGRICKFLNLNMYVDVDGLNIMFVRSFHKCCNSNQNIFRMSPSDYRWLEGRLYRLNR